MQSAYERIGQYVKLYNDACNARNVADAVKYGELAVRDAKDELKKSNLLESTRKYYQTVVDSISPFLDKPTFAVKNNKTAGASGEDDKIKSTDWFASPVPNLNLSDIAGLSELQDEFLYNIFAPLDPKYADIYKKYRGEEYGLQVLLYGPPGTGKTHSVKCLAGQLGCKIAVVQIKDVMANLVGDGAKIISEIFEQAKKHDRCIIFFDEIDAIAASREGDDSRHTKEQLTTLLTNMDGFTSKAKPNQIRIVIAATNRPWALDSAVKRGGRFDTQIYVPIPDRLARLKLIENALGFGKGRNPAPMAQDLTVEWLAERLYGYAGADIKSICRQASSLPLKREVNSRRSGDYKPDCITKADFEVVIDKYINSITDDMLMLFDKYKLNIDSDSDYSKYKIESLVRRIGAVKNVEECPFEAWELRFIEDMAKLGAIDNGILTEKEYPALLSAVHELMKYCNLK